MYEEKFIFVAIFSIIGIAFAIIFIWGMRRTLQQYKKQSNGKINGILDALKYEWKQSKLYKRYDKERIHREYLEFKKLQQTDKNKGRVFLRNVLYYFNIIGNYTFFVILLFLMYARLIGVPQSMAKYLPSIGAIGVIILGFLWITLGRERMMNISKPLIRLYPKDFRNLSLDDYLEMIPGILLIAMGGLYFYLEARLGAF